MKLKCAMLVMLAAACGRDGARQQEQGSNMRDTSQSVRVAKDARKTILFVGTSLTAGYGIDPQQAYPALIQKRLDSLHVNYEAINAGVSGETSAGALHRMDWLLRQPVDIFVLETGANDGLRGLPVDSMRANIEHILDDVKRTHPDAKILLIGMESPPNMGQRYVTGFRNVYRELAAKYQVTFLPFLLKGVGGVDSLNQADMVHPNPRGAAIVAETVWGVLKGMLDTGVATRA